MDAVDVDPDEVCHSLDSRTDESGAPDQSVTEPVMSLDFIAPGCGIQAPSARGPVGPA